MMKKYFIITICVVLITAAFSCNKQDALPKTPPPSWAVNAASYAASMTAVVKLPANLLADTTENDELGAFIDDSCRGVGERVQLDSTTSVYFIMIHGNDRENDHILFKYYSGHTSQIYQTAAFLPFTPDGNYGTIDTPGILDLTLAK